MQVHEGKAFQVEHAAGAETLWQESGIFERLQGAKVSGAGKNSEVSRENSGNEGQGSDGIRLCEQLNALAFTLTELGAMMCELRSDMI